MAAPVVAPVLDLPSPSSVALQNRAGGVRLELVFITPSLANAWMGSINSRNFRVLSELTRDKYADDMVAGHFGATPEMAPESNIVICHDPDNHETFLGNGQHRLAACVRAGERSPRFKGFWCGVMQGIHPMAMLRMDVGKKRSLADYLRFLKCDNPLQLAPTLKILYTFKNSPHLLGTQRAGTPDELLELLASRPDIHRAVKFAINASTGSKPIPMTTSWLAVARMLIGEVPDAEKAIDDFWSTLASRDVDSDLAIHNHPIIQLRNILDTRGIRVMKKDRIKPHIMLGLVLLAWNNWRDEVFSTLRFTPGSSRADGNGKGGQHWPKPH